MIPARPHQGGWGSVWDPDSRTVIGADRERFWSLLCVAETRATRRKESGGIVLAAKAGPLFIIYIAGEKILLFYVYAVIVKQFFYKRSANHYSHHEKTFPCQAAVLWAAT